MNTYKILIISIIIIFFWYNIQQKEKIIIDTKDELFLANYEKKDNINPESLIFNIKEDKIFLNTVNRIEKCSIFHKKFKMDGYSMYPTIKNGKFICVKKIKNNLEV
jgi:hypothetical protein